MIACVQLLDQPGVTPSQLPTLTSTPHDLFL